MATTGEAHKFIVVSATLTFGIGLLNSLIKNGQLPSARFLIGSGVVYVGLSALAEGEPEIAKGLSLAVLTTAMLGNGQGVLTYLEGRGELNTQKPSDPKAGAQTAMRNNQQPLSHNVPVRPIRKGNIGAIPGIPPSAVPPNAQAIPLIPGG